MLIVKRDQSESSSAKLQKYNLIRSKITGERITMVEKQNFFVYFEPFLQFLPTSNIFTEFQTYA
jgi:beta-mannanase